MIGLSGLGFSLRVRMGTNEPFCELTSGYGNVDFDFEFLSSN